MSGELTDEQKAPNLISDSVYGIRYTYENGHILEEKKS